MDDEKKSLLAEIAKHNDVTLIADSDHTDNLIPNAITKELKALYAQGVRHLYFEQDPNMTSIKDAVINADNAHGDMLRKALLVGMDIHFYDDRTIEMERYKRYPEESAFVRAEDPYLLDEAGTIEKYAHPEKMKAYINEANEMFALGVEFRNNRMVENLDHGMRSHPNEKSIVMVGAAHADEIYDLDERLRANGHQVVTVEIHSMNSSVGHSGADAPDFIMAAENGNLRSYKNPATQKVQHPSPDELPPFRNIEPVAAFKSNQSGAQQFQPFDPIRFHELSQKNEAKKLTPEQQQEFKFRVKFNSAVDYINNGEYSENEKRNIIHFMKDTFSRQDFSSPQRETADYNNFTHEKSLER